MKTNTCPQNYKFTGYERDPETGLDYAFARYYSSSMGRFMSPDPLGGSVGAPQTLNRYAYVGNDPTDATDPLGLLCYLGEPCVDTGFSPSEAEFGSISTQNNWVPVEWDALGTSGDEPTLTELSPDGVAPATIITVDPVTIVYLNMPTTTINTVVLVGPAGAGGQGLDRGGGAAPQTPRPSILQCTGRALEAKGLSVALDVVGAIPGLGNLVSAGAAGARVVNDVVQYGGGIVGAATSLSDKSPVGAVSASAGLGLTLADASLGGTKVIPIVGNVISGLTGLYDIYGGVTAYQACRAGN